MAGQPGAKNRVSSYKVTSTKTTGSQGDSLEPVGGWVDERWMRKTASSTYVSR